MLCWVLRKQLSSKSSLLLFLVVLCQGIASSLSEEKATGSAAADTLEAKEKRPGGRQYFGRDLWQLAEKRGGARPFYSPYDAIRPKRNSLDADFDDDSSAQLAEEKRGGGRSFLVDAADKRGGGRNFLLDDDLPSKEKRAGGRSFHFMPTRGQELSQLGHFMAKRPGGRAFYGLDDGWGVGLRGKRPGGRFFNFREKRPGGRYFSFGPGGDLFKRLGGRAYSGYSKFRSYY